MVFSTSSSKTLHHTLDQPSTTPGPSLLSFELRKRDQQCGVVNNYPNAQAPICSGAASLCTFSNSRQGCCDDSENCTFYTSCNGGLATGTCTGMACLQCPGETPYCTRYAFGDGAGGSYDGFGCGVVDIDNTVVYGSVNTQQVVAATTSSSSSSSQSLSVSGMSQSTTLATSTTSTPTSSSSRSKTSSATTLTGTAAPNIKSSESHGVDKAVIGGAIGGGILFLILLVLAIWWFVCGRERRRLRREKQLPAQLSQPMHRQPSQYSQYSRY